MEFFAAAPPRAGRRCRAQTAGTCFSPPPRNARASTIPATRRDGTGWRGTQTTGSKGTVRRAVGESTTHSACCGTRKPSRHAVRFNNSRSKVSAPHTRRCQDTWGQIKFDCFCSISLEEAAHLQLCSGEQLKQWQRHDGRQSLKDRCDLDAALLSTCLDRCRDVLLPILEG